MNKTQFEINGNLLAVKRSFNADVTLVWRAWTEAELLDQWWAPSPWKSETRQMEFKEGGFRLYAMVGSLGEKHWSRNDYHKIEKLVSFSGQDSFCDQNGVISTDLPIANYFHQFIGVSEKTEVRSEMGYASEQALKKVIEMGMKQGLEIACDNLDNLLEKLKNN